MFKDINKLLDKCKKNITIIHKKTNVGDLRKFLV